MGVVTVYSCERKLGNAHNLCLCIAVIGLRTAMSTPRLPRGVQYLRLYREHYNGITQMHWALRGGAEMARAGAPPFTPLRQ